MDNLIENFKKYAPGFTSVFSQVEKILDTEEPNNKLFTACVETICQQIIAEVADTEILKFLLLPSTKSSSSYIIRPSLLEITISTALEQAMDPKKGNNCFSASIKKETLVKNGFLFCSDQDINDFGEKIKTFIPKLSVLSFGAGILKEETYFSLYYKYSDL